MRKPTVPKQEIVALSVFTKLMRAAESVSVDVHQEIAEAGLTISQFGILEALYHLGPMTQKEIGKKILKSPGNITMVIDNLEKRNLVRRKRRSDDRRSYTISLTSEGKALIATLFPPHSKRISKRISVLSEEEQHLLASLLKKLGRTPVR